MKKLLFSIEARKDNKKRGFAFWPTIALEAHPSEHRWWLIWLEVYEIDYGKKWIIN